MWNRAGNEVSVFNTEYPTCDNRWLEKDEIEIPVQINGNVKFVVTIPKDSENEQVEKIVLNDERLAGYFYGRSIKKVIVVRGKIVNIVVA